MLTTFEDSHIKKDEHGNLWIHQDGKIRCEAFFQTDDESLEDMLSNGYILVPYLFDGQQVFVEGQRGLISNDCPTGN